MAGWRHWVEVCAIEMAGINVVLHVVLLATGSVHGPFALTMLVASSLCLLCMRSILVRRDSVGPWVILGSLNALMLASHVLGSRTASHGAGHAMHAGNPSLLLGSSTLSLLEVILSLVVVRPLVRRRREEAIVPVPGVACTRSSETASAS